MVRDDVDLVHLAHLVDLVADEVDHRPPTDREERLGGVLGQYDDPWGTGSTLEWATASPPAYANFAEPPVVTSATPLLDDAPDRTAEGTTR